MYAIHSSVFSCMRRCCVCLGFLVTIGPCTCSLLLLCMMDMARVVLFKADATSTVGAIVWSKLNLQRHIQQRKSKVKSRIAVHESGTIRYHIHLTATECHLLYGITQCYLPPDTSEHTPRVLCFEYLL